MPVKMHSETEKIKCKQCDFETVFERNMKEHVEKVHKEEKKIKCDHCDFETYMQGV